jgi:hypothetical protein
MPARIRARRIRIRSASARRIRPERIHARRIRAIIA